MVGFLISMLLPYESFRPHIEIHYKSQNTSIDEWLMYIWACPHNDPESLFICTYRRQKFRSCLDEFLGCFVVYCLRCIVHHSIVTHQVEIILQWGHNIVKCSSLSGEIFCQVMHPPFLNINSSSSIPSLNECYGSHRTQLQPLLKE